MRKTLLGVDVAALILSCLYLWGALSYSRGTFAQPGPGLYPLFVGALLVLASIGSILTDFLKPYEGGLEIPKGKDFRRMLTVLGAGVAYVVILPFGGHLVAAMVTMFVVMQAMGTRSWIMKIGFTLLTGLVFYGLFDRLLQVPMPQGIWR
jgi:putative tricarboxylic transport membrane protein